MQVIVFMAGVSPSSRGCPIAQNMMEHWYRRARCRRSELAWHRPMNEGDKSRSPQLGKAERHDPRRVGKPEPEANSKEALDEQLETGGFVPGLGPRGRYAAAT